MATPPSQAPGGAVAETVKVVVRCRPLSAKEISEGCTSVVEMDADAGQVTLLPAGRPAGAKAGGGGGAAAAAAAAAAAGAGALRMFTFDQVYDGASTQAEIFQVTAAPIVDSVMEGINGTIFAYGQTGSGKTYTMEGPPHATLRPTPGDNDGDDNGDGDAANTSELGIAPAAFRHVFESIRRQSGAKCFLVTATYLEIYNDEIRDLLVPPTQQHQLQQQQQRAAGGVGVGCPPLLAGRGLELRDAPAPRPGDPASANSGAGCCVEVRGLRSVDVTSAAEAMAWLEYGRRHRTTGETRVNAASSRSHAVFTLTVRSWFERDDDDEEQEKKNQEGEAKAAAGPAGGAAAAAASPPKPPPQKLKERVAKLNLVDLAGSERQIKTGAEGGRQSEGIQINLSLSALGKVISDLAAAAASGKPPTHIKYRDSKLTRLLQDSLGGNTRTVMIANVGPADFNRDETHSTLQYASRAKKIVNAPRVNEDPKDAIIRQFQGEIARLQAELAAKRARAAAAAAAVAAGVGGGGLGGGMVAGEGDGAGGAAGGAEGAGAVSSGGGGDSGDALVARLRERMSAQVAAAEAANRAAAAAAATAEAVAASAAHAPEAEAAAEAADAAEGANPNAATTQTTAAPHRRRSSAAGDAAADSTAAAAAAEAAAQALAHAREKAEAEAKADLEKGMALCELDGARRRELREALRAQVAELGMLQRRAAEAAAEEARLAQRIAALESRVLHGGGGGGGGAGAGGAAAAGSDAAAAGGGEGGGADLSSTATSPAAALERLERRAGELDGRAREAQRQLAAQRRQREGAARREQELELQRLDLNARRGSLEGEVAERGRQMRALYARYTARRAEVADLSGQFERERAALSEHYCALSKRIKLRNLQISSYVPQPHQAAILARCRWDEYSGGMEVWRADLAGNAVRAAAAAEAGRGGNGGGGEDDDDDDDDGPLDVQRADTARLPNVYLWGDGGGGGGDAGAGPAAAPRAAGGSGSSSRPGSPGGARSLRRPGSRGSGGGGAGGGALRRPGGGQRAPGSGPGLLARASTPQGRGGQQRW